MGFRLSDQINKGKPYDFGSISKLAIVLKEGIFFALLPYYAIFPVLAYYTLSALDR